MKKAWISVVVIIAPIFLFEGTLRIFYHRVDLLRPSFIADAELQYAIAPNASGHDALGFRNREFKKIPIVAIGDSQTYSIITPRGDSWPAQLEGELSKSVYNMAIGGYGSQQYKALTGKAINELGAKHVLWGVFLGDDAAPYSTNEYQPLEADFKTWMEANSFLFNWLFYHWPGDIVRKVKTSLSLNTAKQVTLELCNLKTCTSILVGARDTLLDINRPNVKQGVEQLLENIVSASKRVKLTVVLIPTKAAVLQAYIPKNDTSERHDDNNDENAAVRAWQHSIQLEKTLSSYLKSQLKHVGITVIDTLPALKAAAQEQPIYFYDYNGHIGAAGQRAIAQEIARITTKEVAP
ncbi:hypothetical protein MHM87_04815 [Alteromonas sp. Cnat3-28]|uniref:SGNH/GDSL hydrolase family protein n=1 Tax=Alteromonas sp. Cnat3-28 TaxID=2917729 RepID=UPI001EF5AFE6|nr:hypothetical protein [Alteromonas sp. Cnat3-28]MCG7644908.1 hypothetical protein [Alteromonas sp. Cnat3-28]